jgi:hypothetical protein
MEISVDWTGNYPSLCLGEWEIIIDGIKLTGIEDNHFDTYRSYQEWSFDGDWEEHWEDYKDGLAFDEWFEKPPNGLKASLRRHGIYLTLSQWVVLYRKIKECDWRSSSCGGCR